MCNIYCVSSLIQLMCPSLYLNFARQYLKYNVIIFIHFFDTMSYCDRKVANFKNFFLWIAKCGHVGRYSGIALLMAINILAKASNGVVL